MTSNVSQATARGATVVLTLPSCVFCSVVAGRVEARVVLADEHCLAILDQSPAAQGHTLVLPRHHVTTLWECDEETAAAVMRTSRRVAGLIQERLTPDGITMRQNNGAASGQRVEHLHVHLVPRWHGDGHIGWPREPLVPVDNEAVLRILLGGPTPHQGTLTGR